MYGRWKYLEVTETSDLELREKVKHRMGEGEGRLGSLRPSYVSPVLEARHGLLF